MPLTDGDQHAILLRAKALILTEFHDDFQHLYSYAVAVLEVAPEQANNEIRNALNHIARALCADSIELADNNLGQATGHIERAKRDCLKLANIHLHEQIKSDLLNIEFIEGAVPFSIKQRLTTLEHRGADTRMAEALGDPAVADQLADLFADLKQFREEVALQFNIPNHKLTMVRRFLRRLQRNFSIFGLGVAAAIIGGLLLVKLFGVP